MRSSARPRAATAVAALFAAVLPARAATHKLAPASPAPGKVISRLAAAPPAPEDGEDIVRFAQYSSGGNEETSTVATPSVACSSDTGIVVGGSVVFAEPGCDDGSLTTQFAYMSHCESGTTASAPTLAAAVEPLPGCTDRPLRRARVELWEDCLLCTSPVAVTTTDNAGRYSFCVPNAPDNPADIFVVVKTCADAAGDNCGRAGLPFSTVVTDPFDTMYHVPILPTADVARNMCVGTALWNFIDHRTQDSAAEYMFDLIANDTVDSLATIVGWTPDAYLHVRFPEPATNFSPPRIANVELGDFQDPDVVLSMFARFVLSRLYGGTLPDTPNCNPPRWGVPSSRECAWVAGWATFLQGAIQGSSLYEDRPSPGVPPDLRIDLEPPDPSAYGEDDVGAVSATLWDMYDAAPEPWDAVALGLPSIWDATAASHPTTVCSFLAAWQERNSASPAVLEIAKHHGITCTCSPFEAADPNPDLFTPAGITQDVEQLARTGPARDGAATDGVTRLVLRAALPGSGEVEFAMPQSTSTDADGMLSGLDGSSPGVSTIVYTVHTDACGDEAFALYRTPAQFNPPAGGAERLGERSLGFRMRYTPDIVGDSIERGLPFQLVRPPVVLIHGLWSSQSEWDNFPLANDSHFRVTRADYHDTNASHFTTNLSVPITYVRIALDHAREDGIAATQADVVAHSMGGLITRERIALAEYPAPTNFNAGDIHELVTLDTPHEGSPFADRLLGVLASPQGGVFSTIMALARHPVDEGAIEDLATGSAALRAIPATRVRGHAVVGIGGNDDSCPTAMDIGPVYLLLKPLGFTATTMFGVDRHDCIVSQQSQRGGIVDGAQMPFDGPEGIHTQVTRYQAPSNHVVDVLNAKADGSLFAPFPAPYSPTGVPAVAALVSPRAATPLTALVITAPSDGMPVLPGQTIEVDVERGAGVTVSRVIVLTADTGAEDDTPPFSVSLTVPNTAVGPYRIVPAGIDGAGNLIVGTPIEVQVTLAARLTGLEVRPPHPILYAVGDTLPLAVIGHYDDGVARDVTSAAAGTTYRSSESGTIGVSRDGRLSALAPGAAMIEIRNGSVTSSIRADSRGEACGNGVLEGAEGCDDGNTIDGDGCSAGCRREPRCGDGVLDLGEQCDDGNRLAGDGCSPACQLEAACASAAACDDRNPCTRDDCDPAAGCIHKNVAEGTSCADADPCNGVEACRAGACVPGTAPDCRDTDECTDDGCSAPGGCSHGERPPTTPSGVVCSVENVRDFLHEPPQPACPRRCPLRLTRLLDRGENLIQAAGTLSQRKCRRKLGAAMRVEATLTRRVRRLVKYGYLAPRERGAQVEAEVERLQQRTEALVGSLCVGRQGTSVFRRSGR